MFTALASLLMTGDSHHYIRRSFALLQWNQWNWSEFDLEANISSSAQEDEKEENLVSGKVPWVSELQN